MENLTKYADKSVLNTTCTQLYTPEFIPPCTFYCYNEYYYTIRDTISTGPRKYRIVITTKHDLYRRISIDVYYYYYYTQKIVFIVIFLYISTGCLTGFFQTTFILIQYTYIVYAVQVSQILHSSIRFLLKVILYIYLNTINEKIIFIFKMFK